MADTVDWMIIKGLANREIGALGFINNRVAIIAAFYDDRDGNMDGVVSWTEAIAAVIFPISIKNSAVMTVAIQAQVDDDVYSRDPDFKIVVDHMFQNFALGLIADGVYAVYFGQAISSLIKPIAGRIARNVIVQYAIRKGMEATVKRLYDSGVKH
jgi:hypothetical protein